MGEMNQWPEEDWHPASKGDVGELRIALSALWRNQVRQQEQINELREQIKLLRAERHLSVSSISITPVPEFMK